MASPADRFTRLEKIAVFLIAMGEARSREILADFDLATIEQINNTIGFLGDITPQEKAAVMIEFGDFFYEDKPLSSKLHSPVKTKSKLGIRGRNSSATVSAKSKKKPSKVHSKEEVLTSVQVAAEQAATEALNKLKTQVGSIDWSKAGYDFGDGFKGSGERGR